MKNNKKNVLEMQKSIDYLRMIFNFPDLTKASETENKIQQALKILVNNKCKVTFKAIGKHNKKCMFCNLPNDEKNIMLDLPCPCLESCHKKCLAQTALVMSPELNENKIIIACLTCARYIPFQTILTCFEKGEVTKIKSKYHCKFCDKSISIDVNAIKIKTCICQQNFHQNCLKNAALKTSPGFNQAELQKTLICWNCTKPLDFELLKQCFTEKELIDFQNAELDRIAIEALMQQDKEEIKMQAANKTAICDICGEIKVIEKDFITLDCDHRFCKECLVEHAEAKINDLLCTEKDLICPDVKCRKPISNHILKFILATEKFNKYDDFVLHHNQSKIIGNNEVAIRCPNATCINFFVMDKNSGISHQFCELCKLLFCVNGCKHPHKGKTCKQYHEYLAELQRQEEERRLAEIQRIAEEEKRQEELKKFNEWKEMNDKGEEQFNLLVAKEKLKACPKCNIWVQKTDGCNHITCKKCGHQFCYICGRADYTKCGDQFKQV